MKRNAFILSFLAITLSFTSFMLPAPSLVGKWKGASDGEIGVVTFYEKGFVSFVVDGEEIGGENYSMDGMIFDMYYEVDNSVTPHNLDFVIKLDEGQVEVARMKGIYQFGKKKTLQISMKFDGGERPSRLDPDSEDFVSLKRTK